MRVAVGVTVGVGAAPQLPRQRPADRRFRQSRRHAAHEAFGFHGGIQLPLPCGGSHRRLGRRRRQALIRIGHEPLEAMRFVLVRSRSVGKRLDLGAEREMVACHRSRRASLVVASWRANGVGSIVVGRAPSKRASIVASSIDASSIDAATRLAGLRRGACGSLQSGRAQSLRQQPGSRAMGRGAWCEKRISAGRPPSAHPPSGRPRSGARSSDVRPSDPGPSGPRPSGDAAA